MPAMTEVTCKWCKTPFMARTADVKRGWGKFCSKSCKANQQEKRTGQNARYKEYQNSNDLERMHQNALANSEMGWDAHKDY